MKRVSAGKLPNGFRFYTQFDPRAHVSGVGVKAGAIHDPLARRGTCHLTEHILGGYTRKDELKLEEYQCGPEEDINIRTDRYSTFYGHDLILRREYTLELLDIFARNLRNLIITPQSLATEKSAVQNEYYLRGIDIMENLLEDLVHQTTYKKNPARNRIDCELAELKRTTIADIRKFVRKYYIPGNMFLIILDQPFRKAKRLAEQYFGDLRPSSIPRLSYDFSETRPALTETKILEVERKGIHQYHVAIAFPTEAFGHKDDVALDVLAEIWGWRIRDVLRDQNQEWGKGTYRALTFTPRSFVHGMMYATFATPSKEFAKTGAEKIIQECEALKNKWVPDDELVAFSNKLYNNYQDAFSTSPGTLAEMIIDSACNGDEDMHLLNSYIGRLSCVGKKSLLRVANEYFTTPNYVQVVIKPTPE